MSCQGSVIQLGLDTPIKSELNGDAKVYWTQPATYPLTRGASALQVYLQILEATNVNALELVGEYSIDGKTWVRWAAPQLAILP